MAAPNVSTQFIGVNKDATELYIKDTTGLYVAGVNDGGYTSVQIADIKEIIFTISDLSSSTVYSYKTEPINDVVSGKQITVTPAKLGATEEGLKFEDGVYDLNEYVVSNDVFSLTAATAGNKFFTLSVAVTEDYLSQFDSVVDNNGVIYNIDKTQTFNATTVYTVEALVGTITVINPTFRANVKFYNTTAFDYRLGQLAASYCTPCSNGQTTIDTLYHKIMGEIAFEQGDYTVANKLISLSFNSYC